MKTKGMTFTTDEVRALIEGRKTQMRHTLKVQPVDCDNYDGIALLFDIEGSEEYKVIGDKPFTPPCTVGDLIYVREPHAFVPATAYRCSAGIEQTIHPHNEHNACVYKENFDRCVDFTWFSGARMPRWPSRLTLKVTSVRVERVQNISKQDAEAEGFNLPPVAGMSYAIGARTNFRMAWERLYGESWSRNDWVWVIDFEVIRKNVDIHLAGEAA